jgi:hypothetical protein
MFVTVSYCNWSPMKTFSKSILFTIATLSVTLLASCADKMTDRHSELSGGDQGPPPAGLKTYMNEGTPSNTDGAGRPLADGKVNTMPDSMWNQNSPFEAKPF